MVAHNTKEEKEEELHIIFELAFAIVERIAVRIEVGTFTKEVAAAS